MRKTNNMSNMNNITNTNRCNRQLKCWDKTKEIIVIPIVVAKQQGLAILGKLANNTNCLFVDVVGCKSN